MPDPITNSAFAGATQTALGSIIYKILVYIIGPILAAVVVMFMAQPRSPREWFSAMISTVMASIGLGSYVLTHYLVLNPAADELSAMQAGAVYFMCGLPGWFFVRALFYTFEQHRNTNILELWQKLRGLK
ncbi:hypothetical protein [Rappaport israeli]|uniref:hypothetical protein n=1 Tax=Rappaport israeli TaxID=1839807 RepID=UPI0009309432|nr:hypothetical protein [Rappaport israeli]